MQTLTNPYASDLIQHFSPFHAILTDMSNSADTRENQGGMTWDFQYLHGKGHTARLHNTSLSERIDFDDPPDLETHTHDFATLIWSASGFPTQGFFEADYGELPDLEYEIKKTDIISKYYDKASDIIALFKACECDKCFMSFYESRVSIGFNSVVLKGPNAIIHSAFWSMD